MKKLGVSYPSYVFSLSWHVAQARPSFSRASELTLAM